MKKKAFTLIELLVVIAIIAVLMGILMPALRKVKEQARQKSCATRIRQHVLTMHMYADDNNGKFPLPTSGGFWLWDLQVDTVNYMLKTGLTQEIFYCPSNDNQQKNLDLYWEYNTGTWDGSKFTDTASDQYIVSGYCYLLDLERGGRPAITGSKTITGPKEWVRTNRQKNQSQTELVIDATLGQPETGAKHEYNFGMVTAGGMFGGEQIHDRTSHLRNDYEPTGGNMGFLDSHVEWRTFENMKMRFGTNPGFWW